MSFDTSRSSFADSSASLWAENGWHQRIESSPSASDLLPSAWLERAWRTAGTAHREATWNALPDQIGDAAEAGSRVLRSDILFLRDRAFDGSETSAGAVAALRTLARLCEDEPRWIATAAPTFRLALQDPWAGLRHTAVEGIWQARMTGLLTDIRDAVSSETDPTVRATMEHVLAILAP